MRKIITLLLFAFVLTLGSCKKSTDACIEKFVGTWNGSINSGCYASYYMGINPGTNSCEVLFPNLPYNGCDRSSYLVKGTVTGDSVFIASQPFGLNTVTAHGAVYLNQFTMEVNASNGYHAVLSLTK